MANKNIKGIKVEIGGDTTQLGEALDKSKNKSKDLQKELRDVNKLLKGDPQSVELLAQKEEILKQRVSEAKTQLDLLKGSQEKVQELFEKGDIGEEDYRTFKRDVERAQQSLDYFEGEAKEAEDALKDVGNAAKESGDKAKNSESGFTIAKGAIANLASEGITKAIEGLKELGSKLVDFGKQSFEGYAEYEQLVGGVDTLFKDDSGVVQKNAQNAFKTAGMSANEYMATVTDISASLIQGLGGDTKKAAEYADLAITDMSDNANKMGTSIDSIVNAYQGFAKQNYSMLDNLKLGYGGTQAEMYRLLSDAAKLDETFAKSAVFNIDDKGHLTANYHDIAQAIHIVQSEMGITGTTAKEASETIEGSQNTMKAAWENFLTTAADKNGDLEASTDQLVDSVITYGKNAVPIIKTLFENAGELFDELLSSIFPKLKREVPELKPLIEPLEWILNNRMVVINALGAIGAAFAAKKAVDFAKGVGDTVKNIGSALSFIPKLITKLAAQTSATAAATGAQEGLNLAMNANPAGLVVAGIAAILTIMGLLIAANNDSADSFENLELKSGQTIGELHKKLDEEKKKWQDLKEEREKALSGTDAKYGDLENERDRLYEIVDTQGKIKEGYEEEAEIITTKLSDALGIDIEIHDNVIGKYQELQGEIDKTIAKKKLEAVQSAYSGEYEEALKSQTDSWQNWQDELEAVALKEEEIQKLQNKKTLLLRRGGAGNTLEAHDIDARIEKIKYSLNDEKQRAQEAEQIYLNNLRIIENYENAAAAIANGNAKEIADASSRLRYNFKTAENFTREALEQQVIDLRTNYDRLKNAVEKGAPGVSQAMVDEAEHMLNQANIELNKLNLDVEKKLDDTSKTAKEGGKNAGENIVGGLREGITEGEKFLKRAVSDSVNLIFDTIKSEAQINSPSKRAAALGQNIGHTFANNIGGQADYTEAESRRLAQAAFDALNGLPDAGAAQSWALRTHGFASAGAGAGSDYNSVLNKIARALGVIEQNAQTDVRLNDGTLVGSTVGKYDAALAVRAERKHRGW